MKLKENPELLGQLEEEIKAISGAVRRLMASALKPRAIQVLIHDALPAGSSVGMRDIEVVLNTIQDLDNRYLKRKIKEK